MLKTFVGYEIVMVFIWVTLFIALSIMFYCLIVIAIPPKSYRNKDWKIRLKKQMLEAFENYLDAVFSVLKYLCLFIASFIIANNLILGETMQVKSMSNIVIAAIFVGFGVLLELIIKRYQN